jgi:uncharacterized protein DUF6194
MDQGEIVRYIAKTFPGVDVEAPTDGVGADDTFFIYDPDRNFEPKQRFPFATIVTKDYPGWDESSNRPGIYRLNIGVSRETFRRLFPAAEASAAQVDYAALDQLMPHPAYAAQSWLSVLNPSAETFASLQPLLDEAYNQAVKRITAHGAPEKNT